MGTKHKHYDVIVAWAAGEEIEYWSEAMEKWFAHTDPDTPAFRNFSDWRIKPKRIKKEGWVNVYLPDKGWLYATEEDANEKAGPDRKACIRIEWEEEE